MSPTPSSLLVSVVIPAHNAEATLPETLESLLAQTFPDWEAIVVDDGSQDGTAAVAEGFAARDPRIKLRRQAQAREGYARNAGVEVAHGEWVLFLDADDWILPAALERLVAAAAADPSLDAVHCGWARVSEPEGEWGDEYRLETGDLFDLVAGLSAFPIHSCLVRRTRAIEAGLFGSQVTCADWDFWQRFARMGARFGTVRQSLVRYRIHGSKSTLAECLLTDGLDLIATGHGPDSRVAKPDPRHVRGAPLWQLPERSLLWVCWCAGIALAQGRTATKLLEAVTQHRFALLSPALVAEALFQGSLRGACRPPSAWSRIWPTVEACLDEYLAALEVQAGAPGLAHRSRQILERRGLREAYVPAPFEVGRTLAVPVEATEPLPDIVPGEGCERVFASVTLEGQRLGVVELPVCDGLVPSSVLADALATQFWWQILASFFKRTVYPQLRLEGSDGRTTVWRGGVQLVSVGSGASEREGWLHDAVGWTVLLQEIWGQPAWPGDAFYDPLFRQASGPTRAADEPWLALEASENLPDVRVGPHGLRIEFRVGGVPVCGLSLAGSTRVRAQELRAALTTRSGPELGVACAKGLLGAAWSSPDTLRARLARAAGSPATRRAEATAPAGVILAPGAAAAVARAIPPGRAGRVIACRREWAPGTSASRHAALPVETEGDVVAATDAPLVEAARSDGPLGPLHYAPDLLWDDDRRTSGLFPPLERATYGYLRLLEGLKTRLRKAFRPSVTGRAYDRHSFEALFASRPDPWAYVSAYEQRKYEQTLELRPEGPIGRALELACAEGRFTVQLAPHVGRLVAADISEVALARSRARCEGVANVDFIGLDLFADPIPGPFDLIVCSEVLYYAGSRDAVREVGRKLAAALAPGGHLLLAHTNLAVEEDQGLGLDWAVPIGARGIGEQLASVPSLGFVQELRTPLYRIQLFRREDGVRGPRKAGPRRVVDAEHEPPLPHVAARFRRAGERPRDVPQPPATTEHLPVLMYHRVAPTGADATKRYRVTPEAFEEQLRYLRGAGFVGVRLDEWREAAARRQPLPGRRILITFDDACADFRTWAWPLLRRYGCSALVFVVTDRIGESNSWDAHLGEDVPLLSWADLRALRDEGVLFGSHSATHRPLSSLSPVEMVRELARSRTLLRDGLERPVDAIAYPSGDTDRVVEHLAGAVGYVYGFTTRGGAWGSGEPLLSLPRVEVSGFDDLEAFVAKLGYS